MTISGTQTGGTFSLDTNGHGTIIIIKKSGSVNAIAMYGNNGYISCTMLYTYTWKIVKIHFDNLVIRFKIDPYRVLFAALIPKKRSLGSFLKCNFPKTMGFNTKAVEKFSMIWGYPKGNPQLKERVKPRAY